MSSKLFQGCSHSIREMALKELLCLQIPKAQNTSCNRETNTCGKSLQELLGKYNFYTFGDYWTKSSWEDIDYPWGADISSLPVQGLRSFGVWGGAIFTPDEYSIGDRFLALSDFGTKIVLYEATQPIPNYPTNPNVITWKEVCSIELSKAFRLWSEKDITSRYIEFSPNGKAFWSRVIDSWDENLQLPTKFWNNFYDLNVETYKVGEVVYKYSECRDLLTLFIAYNPEIESLSTGAPEPDSVLGKNYWYPFYYLALDTNICKKNWRTRDPEEAYDLIKIGSSEQYVEIPKPYSLRQIPDLDKIRQGVSPERQPIFPGQCPLDVL